MKTKYKTIAELYNAVQAGEIDESELTIILDNDWTGWFLGEEDDNSVGDGHGYDDYRELYELLFPKAEVMHV